MTRATTVAGSTIPAITLRSQVGRSLVTASASTHRDVYMHATSRKRRVPNPQFGIRSSLMFRFRFFRNRFTSL